MSAVYDELAALIETFGARPATSETERRVRDYLARQLQAHGIRTVEQPFRSVPSLTPPWLTVSLLFALSGALAFYPSQGISRSILLGCAALCSLMACLLYWGLVSGKWEVMRFFPKRESANLIGIVPARQTPTRRVVLMAHIDSQRAMLLWHPKLVRQFGQSFIVQTLLLALHGLGALVIAYGLLSGDIAPTPLWSPVDGGRNWGCWLMLPGSLLSLWGIFVLLHREWVLDWVQGANDNGSGVAVVLTLLKELAHQPLEEVEVWGVFTGCEEVGTFPRARSPSSASTAAGIARRAFYYCRPCGAWRTALPAEGSDAATPARPSRYGAPDAAARAAAPRMVPEAERGAPRRLHRRAAIFDEGLSRNCPLVRGVARHPPKLALGDRCAGECAPHRPRTRQVGGASHSAKGVAA
jgi:hypothetical protein